MITVSTGAGFLPSTVLTFTETTSLEGPHPNFSKVPGGSFSQFRRDFECNSIRASPRGAGKPKVFPRFTPKEMGTFAQFPLFQALQRSGSPLVVPENVLEAQSGWKLLTGWSWVKICSPQVARLLGCPRKLVKA